MKKIITSAGLMALGAVGVQAAGIGGNDYPSGFGAPDMSRPWSVSASLRGFYDDNYLTAPDSPLPGSALSKQDSWGFSILPSVSLAWSNGQTDIGAKYTFGLYYYADRPTHQEDYSHQFDIAFNHSFSPRYSLYVADSFVYSQEPDVIFNNGVISTPYRTEQNNFRNTGSITFNAQLSEVLTAVIGYQNTLYDYTQDSSDIASAVNPLGVGSYSALLDRQEHNILANLRWQVLPRTVALLGYNFQYVNFTADEPISGPPFGPLVLSGDRNSYNHIMYVGAEQTFTADFSGSIKAGAEYTDSYNLNPHFTQWDPYGELNLRYGYGLGSYVEAGFRQFFTQTDVYAANTSSSVLYASLNHKITPQLTGSVIGSAQYSKFNGNAVPGAPSPDGQDQWYYLAGINLSYQFVRYLSADVGYNFDALRSSAIGRYDWTRNRVYFGLTATY